MNSGANSRRGLSRGPWVAAGVFIAIDALLILIMTWDGGHAAEPASSSPGISLNANESGPAIRRARGPVASRRAVRARASSPSAIDATIQARFKTPDGSPAAHANIDVYHWYPEVSPAAARSLKIATLTTDGDGRIVARTISIDPRSPLEFRHAQHGCASVWPQSVLASDRSLMLGDVDLAVWPVLRGRIEYQSGEPVARASINGFSHECGYGQALANERGEFEINTLPSGDATLWVADGESAPKEVFVTVEPTPDKEPVVVTLERGRALAGRVERKGGAAAYPARVFCVSAKHSAIGSTRRDGTFRIPGLPLDEAVDVEIYTVDDAYVGGRSGVTATENNIRITVAPEPAPGTVTFQLVDDGSGQPVEERGEARLYRLRGVELLSHEAVVRRDLLREDDVWSPPRRAMPLPGTPEATVIFRHGLLGGSRFFVTVVTDGFFPFESETIVADPGEQAGPIALRLQRPCSIEGRSLDPDGQPAEWQQVLLTKPMGAVDPIDADSIVARGQSRVGGSYRISNIRPGDYELRLRHGFRRVSLRSGENLKDFDVQMR